VVYVVARGDGLDLAPPRVLNPACQDKMSVHPSLARLHGGEAHANLKGDASLFRNHCDRTAVFDGSPEGVERCDNLFRLSAQMFLQCVASARV
jgi:hypothetical protein